MPVSSDRFWRKEFKMKTKWQQWISREVSLEYKTSLYCFCLYFFYACHQLLKGVTTASIVVLFQMALVAYGVTFIQFYFFDNFDEADHIAGKKVLGPLVCTSIYSLVAYFLNWFDKRILVFSLFMAFLFLEYFLIFYFNRLKRKIDSKHLNQLLEDYKRRE